MLFWPEIEKEREYEKKQSDLAYSYFEEKWKLHEWHRQQLDDLQREHLYASDDLWKEYHDDAIPT